MSALLEWQRAMRAQLLDPPRVDDPRTGERLAIYRHTATSTLVNALRLNYPAVRLLVGDEFFEGAARQFIAANLPRSAYLNNYGESFAGFLDRFAAAATLPYLGDVARLEWAVSRALHAPDGVPLELSRLTALDPASMGRVRFLVRPDVSVLHLAFPADRIWRSVLAADEAAMAAVDLKEGAVHVLIERTEDGVSVERLDSAAGRFGSALFTGQTLDSALQLAAGTPGFDVDLALAGHLRAGRFVDFNLIGDDA